MILIVKPIPGLQQVVYKLNLLKILGLNKDIKDMYLKVKMKIIIILIILVIIMIINMKNLDHIEFTKVLLATPLKILNIIIIMIFLDWKQIVIYTKNMEKITIL